jgi:hypothetical protein
VSRKTKSKDTPSGRPAGERCELCGHWSSGTAYGIDERSGYCDRWERITSRDYWCEEFVSKGEYEEFQQELAEEHEDLIDDDF